MASNLAEELKAKLNKDAKKNIAQTFDEKDDLTIQRHTTGILSLDMVLGKGSNGWGLPIGRIIEVFGPESGGKTSTVLAMLAEYSQKDVCLFVDAEHALNMEYVKEIGVNLDNVVIVQPENSEEAFNALDFASKEKNVKLSILDSVASLLPKSIAELDFKDDTYNSGAKINNRFVRAVGVSLSENNNTMILINQVRERIGGYGTSEYAPGGRGIKHYATVRIEVRKGDIITDSQGNEIGQIVKYKLVKNKSAAPFKTTQAKLLFGKGFQREFCLIELGEKYDIIKKAGAWYSLLSGEKLQGMNALIEKLEQDKDLAKNLEEQIYEAAQ